ATSPPQLSPPSLHDALPISISSSMPASATSGVSVFVAAWVLTASPSLLLLSSTDWPFRGSVAARMRFIVCLVTVAVPGVEHEFGGADLPVDLDVQVQQVPAGGGDLGGEADVWSSGRSRLGLFAGGVNVQVGQIALSQRDQVAVRAEVGLECGDRLAVALYGGCQFARASGGEVTIEGDGVPVDLDGARDSRFDRGVVAGDLDSA